MAWKPMLYFCRKFKQWTYADFTVFTGTENFWLVADYNEIKMAPISDDPHMYAVISGNPYALSFSAVQYDSTKDIVYYSDVNS